MGKRRAPWMPTREEIAARPKPPPREWGIFHWSADGRYPRANAITVYKRRHAADRFVDSASAENTTSDLVVREI